MIWWIKLLLILSSRCFSVYSSLFVSSFSLFLTIVAYVGDYVVYQRQDQRMVP